MQTGLRSAHSTCKGKALTGIRSLDRRTQPYMSERNASVLTSLQAIAKKAKERPEYRFRDLFRLLNEDMLRDSWRYIHKEAAYGVDKVSAAEYEQNLEAN